jgi:DNA polymerase-3 subunit delta
MPTLDERSLRKAIRDKSFERVYYFVGDEDFLKESTARELLVTAVGEANAAVSTEVLRGDELSAEALDTSLNSPPLFSARRAVLIRDVQSLKKDARDLLTRYLARPAEDTLLVLMAPAGEKHDRVLLDAAVTVEFARLSPERVQRWIVHHAATATGTEITLAAAELLQSAVGDDLAALAAELEKLASYTGGGRIEVGDVSAVVGVREEESLGTLLDAVAQRDAPRALGLATQVLAQPRTTVVSVIMLLTTQTLALAWGRAALDRGGSPRALERDYWTLLKEARVFPGRPWKDAVSCWTRSVPGWTARSLRDALRALLAADTAAKETRVTSDQQLLASLVLALCATVNRAAA